nr:flagellar hook-length control protein FliK [Fretibacterium sp.]
GIKSQEKPEDGKLPDDEDNEPAADEAARALSALGAVPQSGPQNIRQSDHEEDPHEEDIAFSVPGQVNKNPEELKQALDVLSTPEKEPFSMSDRKEGHTEGADQGKGTAQPVHESNAQRPQEPVAPRTEDNPAPESAVQRVGEDPQSSGADGRDGSTGNAGNQSNRGQQQAGLRRTAGSDSAAEDRASNQAERPESGGGTSFQSFFEGILSSRRTGAAAAPMSLRPNTPDTAYAPRAEMLRDGLVNVVRFVRADGVRRANVIVDPPALGRISVELTSSTSGVEASVRVSSEQVRQLVQDQISQLRMTLEQQGVQVTQFTVDVQQNNGDRQQGQGGQGENRRRRSRLGTVEGPEEAEDEFRVDLEEGMLHWVA